MIVNWILEKHIFEDQDNLIEAIKNSGHYCLLVDDTDIDFDFDKEIADKFDEEDCVIFHGSLQLGRKIWNSTPFIPGIFLTLDNYECFKYYGYYGKELVNSHYILMGLNDVKRNKWKLFKTFLKEGEYETLEPNLFIRPSNGYKTFTGQLISGENFEQEFDVLCKSYGGLDMDQLVLIAPEQNVREENRFIVINENGQNRIIDGNKYMIDRVLLTERVVDDEAWKYAETIVNNYTPDKAFTIDIAKLGNGEYRVLEIGSFCCAGLYNADLNKIVNEINQLCINEYNEYYNYE